MNATSEGSHTSMCIRSNKPLGFCTKVVKATLDYPPMMQNLHRLSLQCLILGRTPLQCRARTLRSLICPRRMCQSLVMSFSVAMEASLITMLSITLYKFIVRSTLRTVMELLVTFRASSVSENLHPWASKASNKKKIFLRSGACITSLSILTCPLNIFMQILSISTVLHVASFPIRIVPPSKGSYMLKHSFFGHVVCAP